MEYQGTSIVDYSRQEQLDSDLTRLHKEQTNVIVGCGGIGFWLGLFLAMNGHRNFILFDGDKIDNSNLNRIPVPQTWVGLNKAVCLRRVIRTLRPDTRIMVYSAHMTEETLNLFAQFIKANEGQRYYYEERKVVVWDTTDNALMQRKIYAEVKALQDEVRSITYRKIGYEGWNVGSYSNYDVWVDEEHYTTGYRTTRANSISSAISAGLGILAKGITEQDVNVDIKKLIIGG